MFEPKPPSGTSEAAGFSISLTEELKRLQETNDALTHFAEFLARKAGYANTYKAWVEYAASLDTIQNAR